MGTSARLGISTTTADANVEGALGTGKHRVHRGPHVIVNPTLAGATEKPKRLLMRIENHFLRLARIGPYERHPAVTQTHTAPGRMVLARLRSRLES